MANTPETRHSQDQHPGVRGFSGMVNEAPHPITLANLCDPRLPDVTYTLDDLLAPAQEWLSKARKRASGSKRFTLHDLAAPNFFTKDY